MFKAKEGQKKKTLNHFVFFFKLNTGSWSALCFLYLWSIIPQKKCFKTEQLQLCSFFFSLGFRYQTSKEEHWRRLWTSRIPPRPLYDLPSKAEKNITWRGIYVLQPGHHPPPPTPSPPERLCCPTGTHLFRKRRESSHSHDLCQPWWINSEWRRKRFPQTIKPQPAETETEANRRFILFFTNASCEIRTCLRLKVSKSS